MLNKPVLFLIFNRLDTTKQVFEAIRQAKPPRFYIACDGAREDKKGEAEKVQMVRDFVLSNIDWKCEVKTLFQEENLGCRLAVSDALNWFFNKEEDGIVLEDDCLPTQNFFNYCSQMLELYKNDTRIGLISGFNIKGSHKDTSNDYFFSNLGGIWGWASWRRVWKYFNFDSMQNWMNPEVRNLFLYNYGDTFFQSRNPIYNHMVNKKIDSWAYHFSIVRALNSFIAVVPSKNLIKNIGINDLNATHTTSQDFYLETLQTYDNLSFPLKENTIVIPDFEYDYFFLNREEYSKEKVKPKIDIIRHIKRSIRSILKYFIRTILQIHK